tara:strand:+ start:501 stop:758 length:258 start_codon:yes stop_codon:yes gene_type:complete
MCVGGGSRPPPPPPPPPQDESLRRQRAQARREELAERRKLKDEQFQDRVAQVAGQRGRRSLLTGRRGGQGFLVTADLQSKDTLGV